MQDQRERMARMSFGRVYPLYVAKAERKGRTRDEVDEIIRWLTGYDDAEVRQAAEQEVGFERFFAQAPRLNPARARITGVVCGVRVENIEDPLVQQVRYLDKLIDELARGKAMQKILRADPEATPS